MREIVNLVICICMLEKCEKLIENLIEVKLTLENILLKKCEKLMEILTEVKLMLEKIT